MAITSAEIHNQSFSIDRKGYDVDEVDVFLEHVADEIDGLNQQIASLQNQVSEDTFAGFDRPAVIEEEEQTLAEPAPAAAVDESALAEKDAVIAEKDARIADLEAQLEAKKADDNAIAQALIIAQRSADEILANAKADAAATIKDAEDEADRIIDKAENDRQKVIDAIKKLEDDREDAREDYRDLLTDFITDATRKLAEIGEKAPASASIVTGGQHGRYATHVEAPKPQPQDSAAKTAPQAPLTIDGSDAYEAPKPVVPVEPAAPVAAAAGATVAVAPMATAGIEKDFSGFGDAADDFDTDDLD